jgi:hypothetical protein
MRLAKPGRLGLRARSAAAGSMYLADQASGGFSQLTTKSPVIMEARPLRGSQSAAQNAARRRVFI